MMGLKLVSEVTADGLVVLRLVETPVGKPEPDQVIVRVDAAPVNPSDIGLMLAGAKPSEFQRSNDKDGAAVAAARLSAQTLDLMAARIGHPLPVGNEGAGIVIDAGPSVRHMLGRTVAVLGGGMYAQYRTVTADDCILLAEDVTPQQAASAWVNPMTASGMVHTMRSEGHTAIVHTAAASSLGQILNRLCARDGIALVNIVRNAAQADMLRALDARWIVRSDEPDFAGQLMNAIEETRATIAFDAVGGGGLAGKILSTMDRVFRRDMPHFSRYGSSVHKQIYIYGGLDSRPIVLDRDWGMQWSVGGWLLTPFLERIGPLERTQLRQQIAEQITTVFASSYTDAVPLTALVEPETIARLGVPATGAKYLVEPGRP
ncbi:alcohol dehydrogenase catalytic domain-containing protein [Rhizobium skierniewicense]|uniref:alcohol dehydrogenase catalytic domain-containing protein n=1 Tax=Rhizobium skierniewicense TaxID=984260 RepID=UPI001572FA3D|nr:NADH oxidase [Rhizobium skierniewicense]NTF33065.1 NADH oxidase [Rhizobium skierniewicense]